MMTVTITDKAKEYLESKSKELVNHIYHEKKPKKAESTLKKEPQGYLKEKNIIDLGEIEGPLDISQRGFDKKLILKIRNFTDEKVGYRESGFKEIYKIVSRLLKENPVAKHISEKFLVDNIFEWLVDSYRKNLTGEGITEFILTKCNESIIDYRVYVPILNLESDKEFNIGKTNFKYLTEDYVKELSLKIDIEKREEFIKGLIRFKGQLLANCNLCGEKERVVDLSVQLVTFSVDIIRLVSPTVDYPQVPIYYDADFRSIHQVKNDILIQPIINEYQFLLEYSRVAIPFEITEQAWDSMLNNHLLLLHQFAVKVLDTKSELEALIENAIRNFANALGILDLHERITKIFTVLESLLLPNDNAAIIDSVCKYLPKLISKNIIEREKIISTIKEMYKVRSSMIHHAKKKDFEIDDLSFIQRCTRALILKFILLSAEKTTKKEILKEIDDIINRA